ncbi:MAG TPA: amidohydrolase family protein, partial [Paenirhodobacter sp.]
MTELIIDNVALIDNQRADGLRPRMMVRVQAGRIAAITPADAAPDIPPEPGDAALPPAQRIDGRGMLLAPGLINAHTHSQSSALAGFGDTLSHPAFMWRTQAFTCGRTADEIRLSVLLTAFGALRSGTTGLIDHFPGQCFTDTDLEAVLSAWNETGMRVAVAARFFDGAFSDILPAGKPSAALRKAAELLRPQSLDSYREIFDAAVKRWHGADDGRISLFPAPSNPDRCTDAALAYCAEVAEGHDLGIHTHLLETARQKALAQQRYGCSSVARLDALGVLSGRWSCAHSIWLDDTDADIMARHGAIAVLNPESNARLGTGLCPIPMLRQKGVALALGTDGAGSNDNMVMHEAMRAIATLHRAEEPDRSKWLSARDALTIATHGGAQALRQPGLGRIEVGAPADLVLYRTDQPWWMPINDAVAQLVFAETGASVDTVIV